MASKQSYLFLFLLLTLSSFSQETIVFKDSTRVIAKIGIITPVSVVYKSMTNLNGPEIIKPKSEIAYVIYGNNSKDVFILNTNKSSVLDSLNETKKKVGDYIKVNFQLGTVVCNSFCNAPRKNDRGMTYSDSYTAVTRKEQGVLHAGLNVILGNNKYIKHFIGVNILQTTGKYIHDESSIGYSSHATYKSTANFVNFVTGPRFTILKHIHIEALVTLNYVTHVQTTRTGYTSRSEGNTPYGPRTITNFENEPTNSLVETTVSLVPKFVFELPIRKIKIETYIGYNHAFGFRLPWYQFGFNIYPFKKLR